MSRRLAAAALAAAVALTGSGCGLAELSAPDSEPMINAVPEGGDEYDKDYLLSEYNLSLGALELAMGNMQPDVQEVICTELYFKTEATLQWGVDTLLQTVPDEVQYVVSEPGMRADIYRTMNGACIAAGFGGGA